MAFRKGLCLGVWVVSVSAGYGAEPLVSVSTFSVEAASAPAVSVSTSPYEWRAVENRAFRVGEELKFTLKWGVIKGGNSTMSIPDMASIKDRDAFHIVTEARTVGLADVVYKTRDRNETWLDAQSLSTVKYEKHIREGSFRVETAVELDQVNGQSHEHYERLDRGTTNYVTGPIPANTLDVLGSLYYVRTLPLEVGKSYTLDVYDSRKVWPLVVKVKKREKIKVPAGKFNCLKVEPILREPGIFLKKGKKLEVWLTDDERKIPVLMRSEVTIGHVAAELVKYTAGTEPVNVPAFEPHPAPAPLTPY